MSDMTELVSAIVARYHADLETLCEASLTDPLQRGVLVVMPDPSTWRMSLDPSVPYGTIHTIEEWRAS